jgi:hypothetical protein
LCCRAPTRTRTRTRTRCLPRLNNLSDNAKLIRHLLFLKRPRARRERTIPLWRTEDGCRGTQVRDRGGDAVVRCCAGPGGDFAGGGGARGLVGRAKSGGERAVGYVAVERYGRCPGLCL